MKPAKQHAKAVWMGQLTERRPEMMSQVLSSIMLSLACVPCLQVVIR